DVVFDGRAAHVGDETRLAEVESRQDVLDDAFDARVLQPDRIQHAHRRFVHAMRRIAEPRFERGPLQYDRPSVAVGIALYTGVLLAESYAAGKQHDRRVEAQAAERG